MTRKRNLFSELSFILMITILSSVDASPIYKGGKIQYVMDLLEAYASSGSNATSSGITMLDLEEAHREYNTWDELIMEELREYSPTHKLLVDFLLVPLDKTYGPDLIGERDIYSIKAQADFIRMMERSYKKFRPAYLGDRIGEHWYVPKKTDALLGSLYGLKDSRPLSDQLFNDSDKELKTSEMKLEEIVHEEDVYANLKEMELIYNCLNGPGMKVLHKIIIPFYKSLTGPDKDFPAIQRMFLDEMRKLNMGVKDDKIVILDSASE